MVDATVGTIRQYDVVCGRVKLAYTHFGNKFLRKVVREHAKEYQAATARAPKNRICKKVIQIIRSKGGRFLSLVKKNGTYTDSSPMVEISFFSAYEKVSHALRSLYKDPVKKLQFSVADTRKAMLPIERKKDTFKFEKHEINEKEMKFGPDVFVKLIQEYDEEIDAIKVAMQKNAAELMSDEENRAIAFTNIVSDKRVQTGFVDSKGSFLNSNRTDFDASILSMNPHPENCTSSHQGFESLTLNTISPFESPVNMEYDPFIDDITSSYDGYGVSALDPQLCHEYFHTDIIEDDEYKYAYKADEI